MIDYMVMDLNNGFSGDFLIALPAQGDDGGQRFGWAW